LDAPFLFSIFPINGSASPSGGVIIYLSGFVQADIAQSQSPKTNLQTSSRGNFHIAAADQYPTP
jgi:hypothetical protein